MNFREVPLPDSSYSDPTAKSFADMAVINRMAEYSVATGTRSPKMLRDVPGMREYALFGDGPHRGGVDVRGNKLVVSDTHLYQVHSPTEVEQLGEIPGRGLVWMPYNQRNGGSQVLISTGPDAWIFDTVDRSFAKITDPAFVGYIAPGYIGHKFVGIGRSRTFFYNSALEGQDDGGFSYNDIERYQAESDPDGLRTLVVANLEVLVFGEKTTEPFTDNVSSADLANHILFRNKRAPIPHGCASKRGACVVGGVVCFVADNGMGYKIVGYGAAGAVPITPPAIVQEWQRCDLSKCFTYAYEDAGHLVWYVTFPDGHTWGYDLAMSDIAGRPIWHQRQSKNMTRWRANTLFKSGDSWFAGSCNSGMLYQLDWDYPGREGCDEIIRLTRTGIRHGQGNAVRTSAVRLEYNSGSAESLCEHVDAVTPVLPVQPAGFLATNEVGEVAFSETGLPGSWDLKTSPTANAIHRALFVAGYGWLVSSADDSAVFGTQDTGATWTEFALLPTCDSFSELAIGYSPAVGIYVTRNIAQAYTAQVADIATWASATVVSGSSAMQACAGNDTHILMGGNDGKAYRAAADGVFTQQNTTHNSGADIYKVIWDDTNSVWLTVAHVGAGADVCSSPTGLTGAYTSRHTYAGSSKLGESICKNGLGGYILVGDAGLVEFCTSLGGAWSAPSVNTMSAEAIIDIAYSPTLERAVMVGTNGKIAYTDDGGDNLVDVANPFDDTSTIAAIAWGDPSA